MAKGNKKSSTPTPAPSPAVNITIQQPTYAAAAAPLAPGSTPAEPVERQVFEYNLNPAVMHADPTCIRVRHRAIMSKRLEYGLWWMGLFTCGCCNANEALRRTFFEVHENRIEWNYGNPYICGVCDANGFIFFDKAMTEHADRATCCAPGCTHNLFCPTCCDNCGEGIVVYPESMFHRICCCKHVLFNGFANAFIVAEEIRKARLLAPSRQIM